MSDEANLANQVADAIISELDHFQRHFEPAGGALTGPDQFQLRNEPCVGYAQAESQSGDRVEIFICRNYTPSGYSPVRPSIEYASYLSDLGRIITKKPGDAHSFEVKHHRLGYVLEAHAFSLQIKDEFRLRLDGTSFDPSENRIAWIGGGLAVRSLRKLLEGISQKASTRAISYSVQLPDQAILDEAQDEVFRLPFTTYVIITGAPGTGKTTVLLKRLSQKTKKEFLTETEQKGLSDQAFKAGANWILFTPSDLLKVYLKEAMAKEFLPATDDHVKVYRTFRLEVLRDSGFIKVGPHGYFKQAPVGQPLMKRATGAEQLALHKAFTEHLASAYPIFFRQALQEFNNEIRSPLNGLTDASHKVLMTALDIISKTGDVIELREAQHRAADYRTLNTDLNTMVQAVRDIAETLDKVVDINASAINNYVERWQRAAFGLTTEEIDTAVFPNVPPLVAKLKKEVKGLVESLSLARLFLLIPRAYQDFREVPANQTRFFEADSEKAIRDRQLSEPEQDVLLYQALEFTRGLRGQLPGDQTGVPDELRSLLTRFRLLVTVDEATDFSPLELACMERFSLPEGGVTISGDPMQRVTETGLRDWADMKAVCKPYQTSELNVSYRQTERLFNIARDLYKHATGLEPKFKSAYAHRPEDPPALSFKTSKEAPAAHWLVERICEIFTLGGKHLPTTAVLVPTIADVEPLKAALLPPLRENGLEVDASHGGQDLGDSARVRIFPVEHIKGLEFEAVFYVGLDRMAEIHKELIDKYVYVGLSRAKSFLGVSFERVFPSRLKPIEHHFQLCGVWAQAPQQARAAQPREADANQIGI